MHAHWRLPWQRSTTMLKCRHHRHSLTPQHGLSFCIETISSHIFRGSDLTVEVKPGGLDAWRSGGPPAGLHLLGLNMFWFIVLHLFRSGFVTLNHLLRCRIELDGCSKITGTKAVELKLGTTMTATVLSRMKSRLVSNQME